MATIYVLNGANLNLLGEREPEIYGRESLTALEQRCREHADGLGHELEWYQSNHEGMLVDWLHQAHHADALGVIINPGAYSHSSLALRDAMTAIDVPVVEVHISNVFARDEARHTLVTAAASEGLIAGFGSHGYLLALEALARRA